MHIAMRTKESNSELDVRDFECLERKHCMYVCTRVLAFHEKLDEEMLSCDIL